MSATPEKQPQQSSGADWGFRAALSSGAVTLLISLLDLDKVKLPGNGVIPLMVTKALAALLQPGLFVCLAFGFGFWAGIRWQVAKAARSRLAKTEAAREADRVSLSEFELGSDMIKVGETLERMAKASRPIRLMVRDDVELRVIHSKLQGLGFDVPTFDDFSNPALFGVVSKFLIGAGYLVRRHMIDDARVASREFIRQLQMWKDGA